MLTFAGKPLDTKLARAAFRLRLRFQMEDPIGVAVEAIKPVIQYVKVGTQRNLIARTIKPEKQTRMAMKWLVKAAFARGYGPGGRVSDFEQGLVDEVSAVLAGTSSLYQKRFNMHRNPN